VKRKKKNTPQAEPPKDITNMEIKSFEEEWKTVEKTTKHRERFKDSGIAGTQDEE
jgi:hypothetical protein